MKKVLKQSISLLLGALCAASVTGCADRNDSGNSGGGNVKIWTAPSYVKVLQDADYSENSAYASYFNGGTLEISAYKNEYEAAQILLTPEADVKNYDIALSDLKCGEETLGAENFTVYNQKYVKINRPSASHSNSVLGMTPDALLPFAAAKKYGETNIAAGENQAIVVECHTQKTQKSGVYTGKFTVSADGNDYDVPVSVTVHDMTVPDKNSLKTSFLLRRAELAETELDASYEMYERYFDSLLNYRVCSTYLPLKDNSLDTYIAQLKKYAAKEEVSTINFYGCENSSWTGYDFEKFGNALLRVAEESFESGVNLLQKVVYYLSIVDEPHLTKTEHLVAPSMKGLAAKRREVMRYLMKSREEYGVSNALFEEVINSIEHFEFIVTASYNSKYTYEENKSDPENPDEKYVITWCPYMSAFNTPVGREQNVSEGVSAWWYGCNYPVNPYPNYHLDDEPLTARVFSWMGYEYNVTGNLYWRVNYEQVENEYHVQEPPENMYEDYFNNAVSNTSGDGCIVYPGKPYGLDCFVPSLRLINIRDGMEDYEILKLLGEQCETLASSGKYENYDVNDTFSKLYSSLYQGTRVTGRHTDFTRARELLSGFASLAAKGAIVSGVQDKAYSTIVTVYARQGKIFVDGKEAAYTARGEGKEYAIEIKQENAENYLDFLLETEDGNVNFKMYVGGKKSEFPLGALKYSGNQQLNDVSMEKTDAGYEFTVGALKNTKVEDQRQRVYFTGDQVAEMIKKGAQSITIEIESTEDVEIGVRYIGTKNSTLRDFTTQKLQANEPAVITIETASLDWSQFGAVKELRFYLKFDDVNVAHKFCVKSISVAY